MFNSFRQKSHRAGPSYSSALVAFALAAAFTLAAAAQEKETERSPAVEPTEPSTRQTIYDTVTVTSAARSEQLLLEAPVPVSTPTREQIALESGVGFLPSLFDSLPGIETTQGSLFDFKLNTRGLNSAANRRVAVSVDGRDPSSTLTDAQDWATMAFPLDDLARAELIRGPSSALYGSNAFNGILNLVTRSARDTKGLSARASLGNRDTQRLDARASADLGNNWFAKAVASYLVSDGSHRSRHESVEYSRFCGPGESADCLLREATPLPLNRSEVSYAGLRLEKWLTDNTEVVLEGGHGESEGTVFGAATSRFQHLDNRNPWARFQLTRPGFDVSANYTRRDSEFWTLLSGSPSYLDSRRWFVEAKGRREMLNGRARATAGASWQRDQLSTADPVGRETLLAEAVENDSKAAFALLDFDLSDSLSAMVAARWDDSPLHDSVFSPQASIVWAASPEHRLRLAYREAFLTPSYPEYFVRSPLGPALDLSGFESFCESSGVSCGFDGGVPLLGVGNPHLEPEQVSSLELGYSAVLGSSSLIQITLYRSDTERFLQTSVPLVGSALGRPNPDFGPYRPPTGLPADTAEDLVAALQGALGALFPFLTNPTADQPILAPITVANWGRSRIEGLEASFDTTFGKGWSGHVSYAWLHLDADAPLPGLQAIESNAPEHTVKGRVSYSGRKWNGSLRYRWVDSFRWREVLLNGPVLSYDVMDLSANYKISDAVTIGLQVSNLLDHTHYEIFSGDLLSRQVLAHLDVGW